MIIDQIANRSLYAGIGERFDAALRFFEKIQRGDLFVPAQEEDIPLCEGVTIRVRPMITKAEEECRFEAHKREADIHFVPKGVERIGYAPLDALTPGPYDAKGDILFLKGEGPLLTLRQGWFMVAFPNDGHKPCVCEESPRPYTKLIAKIRLME